MNTYEERLAAHQKFEAEIERSRQESEREDLAFRKGFNSIAEMEEAERRAQRNQAVRENQKRYFSEQERQQTLAANRSRIMGSEAYPDLLPPGLEQNVDLSSLEPAQRAFIETHAAESARQQALEFASAEPRFVKGNESSQMLIHVLVVNNLAPVAENFQAAFNLLAAHGLIAVRQVEAAPAPTPAPSVEPEPASPAPVIPEPVRSENPINPATGQPFTDREIEEMDAESFANVFRLRRGHNYKITRSALGFESIDDQNEILGQPR